MKKLLPVVLGLLIAGVLVLVISFLKGEHIFNPDYRSEDSDSDKVIRVGVDANFMPFQYFDGSKIVGMEVDLVNRIAEEIDATVKWVTMDFSSIIPAIKAGKLEIGASGFSVTDKRKKLVDFTMPFFQSALVVITKDGSKITRISDLKGKIIGAQIGTTMADYAIENLKNSKDIIMLDDPSVLITDVLSKRLDAVICDRFQALAMMHSNKELEFFEIPESHNEYAILGKKDSEIIEEISQVLGRLVETGFIKELEKRWIDNEFDNEEVEDEEITDPDEIDD